ncbi:restriction endonuclease subunit S [Lactococcus cremoris]|uniref:restriction endonuclease subunit S n=4 Tax=Lactococcus lactis subsp. cremoris TaxID=1359 RepID=UPI00223B13C5|nr:restriction endonuclease subunit S [Lactococcus cremoris]
MMSKKSPQLRFEGFTDDWEERKLGEVATLSSSKRIHLSDYVTEGIPFYRGSEISTGGITGNQELFISQEKFDEIKEKYGVPSEGDILVTAVGTLGNLWKVDSRRFYYKDGNLIQISKMQVNSDYLLTYFTGGIGKKRLLDSAAGSNQKALTMVKMREITVDFPSEDEQQKIGSFFKQLDDTIALHQRKLDLLKEQKKGYLQKMFPKNGAKVPELRFAGFADDWEEHKLGDYIIQYSEKTKQNNQYPVFTSSRNGLFFQKDYYKGNQIASEDNIGYNIVPRGYFTYRHMSDDLVFKFNINDLADYGIVSTLYPVFTTNEQLNSKYLQYQLNEGSEFRRFSLLQKQGGSRTYMYLNKLQNMILNIPKLEEQQKIGSFFKQLDDTIALHQRKLDLLKEQKKGFLQKMFV